MNIELSTNNQESKLEFQNVEKYSDHSGFCAHIYVKSDGFTGKVFCTFGEYPMDEFISQLESCDKSLKGEAILKPEYDNWFLKFSMNHTGGIGIEGLLYSIDHQLEFAFLTDQTCLSKFIKDLRKWQKQTIT